MTAETKPLSDEEREAELKKVLKPGQIIELCDTLDRLRAENASQADAITRLRSELALVHADFADVIEQSAIPCAVACGFQSTERAMRELLIKLRENPWSSKDSKNGV